MGDMRGKKILKYTYRITDSEGNKIFNIYKRL